MSVSYQKGNGTGKVIHGKLPGGIRARSPRTTSAGPCFVAWEFGFYSGRTNGPSLNEI